MGIARKRRTYWLHAWAFMVGALAAAPARAYELKEPTEGAFVSWRQGDVALHVPYAEPDCDVTPDMLWDSLLIGVEAWRNIGGAPRMRLVAGGPEAADPSDGINSVHVLTDWPVWAYGNTLAVTVSTYESVTGRLLDTDVLINGRKAFGVLDEADPSGERFDLPSVLTHELGHVLGLDESGVRDATMWPHLGRGDVFQRTLEIDDEEGIVALYGNTPPISDQVEPLTCEAGRGPERASWLVALALLIIVRNRTVAGPSFSRAKRPKRKR